MLTNCFDRLVFFNSSVVWRLENHKNQFLRSCAFQRTGSLIPNLVFRQVGNADPPEAFVTAVAPEQVIYGLNHIQVRHLSSHQRVKLQQRGMLS